MGTIKLIKSQIPEIRKLSNRLWDAYRFYDYLDSNKLSMSTIIENIYIMSKAEQGLILSLGTDILFNGAESVIQNNKIKNIFYKLHNYCLHIIEKIYAKESLKKSLKGIIENGDEYDLPEALIFNMFEDKPPSRVEHNKILKNIKAIQDGYDGSIVTSRYEIKGIKNSKLGN